MTSSVLSGTTTKTSSSISEILEWWQADAEEVLYNLGFVQSEPEDVARIPARFFSAPSRAKGIDFQLFLKSQVQRMEMEDPCLMLASRFQQVQALAATADAFFCLYSYVSKTPEVLDRARGQRLRSDPARVETVQGATVEMPLGTPQRRAWGPSVVAQSVPACPQGGSELVPPCCLGTPRSTPPGTPANTKTGHVEWPCPHCQGSSDSPRVEAPSWAWGAEDAPCPLGAQDTQTGPAATRAGDTLLPSLGCAATNTSWTWDTPKQPAGLGTEGDSGFSSDSLRTSPWTNAGSQRCLSKTPELRAASSPCPDKPNPGGRRGRRRRGQSSTCHPRDTAWKEGDASGLRVLGTPLPLSWSEMRSNVDVDSFEMEEDLALSPGVSYPKVLSASEDDDDALCAAPVSRAP
ncbi:PREDICTED: protein TESPA1 [Tinamus guttatus]|uniref:protein TESPA1 n=1 Tax=Tinamus guttatus TaxID=94827 RepID=UPI00052EEDF6|nr:PREDICTED: protein TESPA1 [Tinamus guttatus]